jgi:L-alanine-DL-glutamate epimerase-like enolase superfamily enzyme
MPSLTRRCPVPIALDESCQTPADAARIVCDGAAKAINIKVAKSGLLRSLEIAAVARAAGLKLMIGCMTETGAGLSASVHLALGTGFFEFADLDSDHLLAGPQARRRWTRDGRVIAVKNG